MKANIEKIVDDHILKMEDWSFHSIRLLRVEVWDSFRSESDQKDAVMYCDKKIGEKLGNQMPPQPVG